MHAMSQLSGQQRQNGLISGTAIGADRPASELQAELNQLDGAINDLVQVATELTDRLSPVQMPVSLNGKCDTGGQAPEPVLSPLADEIRAKRRGIDEITRMLRASLCGLAI